MPLEMIPDPQVIRAIRDILAQAIRGPYRFVHHALVPYVRIGPANAFGEPMTVTSSSSLQLRPEGPRTLTGVQQTMDLVIVFTPYLHLVEVTSLPTSRQVQAAKALKELEEGVDP